MKVQSSRMNVARDEAANATVLTIVLGDEDLNRHHLVKPDATAPVDALAQYALHCLTVMNHETVDEKWRRILAEGRDGFAPAIDEPPRRGVISRDDDQAHLDAARAAYFAAGGRSNDTHRAQKVSRIQIAIRDGEDGVLAFAAAEEAVAALDRLERACDELAATRSHATYLAMIDNDNATDALCELDNARRHARAVVKPARCCPAPVVAWRYRYLAGRGRDDWKLSPTQPKFEGDWEIEALTPVSPTLAQKGSGRTLADANSKSPIQAREE